MCGIEALRSNIDDAIECLIMVTRYISATQDLCYLKRDAVVFLKSKLRICIVLTE